MKLTVLLFSLSASCLAQQPSSSLEAAYENKSIDDLRTFFRLWQNEISQISPDEFANCNDTVKQVYNVFEAFFKPFNIEVLGGSEWGADLNKGAEFLIISNAISFGFLTSNAVNTERDNDPFENTKTANESEKSKVENFRPRVRNAVYLDSAHARELTSFLGNDHHKFGKGGIMNPARARNGTALRLNFLNQVVKIHYGHWGGYWHLETQPEVFSVLFDQEMKYAKVEYRIVYEGGYAILGRDPTGKWSILRAKKTWIE